MGLNTTVVILNDALHDIRRDPKFGENLFFAIINGDKHVPAGGHGNAAYVVETHHADHEVLVRVGGNLGKVEP